MSTEMHAEWGSMARHSEPLFGSCAPFGSCELWEPECDHDFRLRGQSINPMIDAVTPLLGLVQRVRQLSQLTDVAALYGRVVSEIQSVEQELIDQGYAHAEVLSFRYMLCCFIDEAVMSREWGSQSAWSEHSLLTRFHNETWGGEKVFVLLARLQEEPARYRHLLEFIYLCLCLGFAGRYRVISQGRDELVRLTKQLHKLLAVTHGSTPMLHLDLGGQVTRVGLQRQCPSFAFWCLGGLLLSLTFAYYHHTLHDQTQALLAQLAGLLN